MQKCVFRNEIYAAGPYLVFRAGEFHKEKMAFVLKLKLVASIHDITKPP
jgi:hypothetical protein